MLSRAGKVMSRKLNLKNETWISKWDQGKEKADLIGEIKTETINITATFGGEFKNQSFLLVLKLFCQKTDIVIYFFILVYLVFFNIAIVSSTIKYWGTLLENKDIAIQVISSIHLLILSFL